MSNQYPKTLSMHIDGEWVGIGNREAHHVINPATGETLADLPIATADDLDRALAASAKAYPLWRHTSVNERSAILHKEADLLRERADDIAPALTLEQGKPLAQAKGEIIGSAGLMDSFAEEAKRCYGRVLVRPAGQQSIVKYEPVGPVAAFSPWNFPIFTAIRKIAPALAAGCSIIMKSAEETPSSVIAVMQALIDAGLPNGAMQLVFGVPDMVSRHLIASPIIRKISFTGSVGVGKHLMKLAAEDMKRTTMELGGHAPVLVFDDCDIEKTLDLVVPQKFRNSGQVCVSPTRFYVQAGIYEKFAEGFAKRAEQIKVGHGLDAATQMGPLANARRPMAINSMVSDARAKGARLLSGGESADDAGFFFRPTVLADVPLEAQIMNDEPFGPVALMRSFESFDEAIEQANRLPLGLAAFAFTENGRRAMLLGDAIEAGMVGINTSAISPGDSPFGGVKQSGHGSEDGPDGLKAYMVTKAVHQA